jgi:hypothetical protein
VCQWVRVLVRVWVLVRCATAVPCGAARRARVRYLGGVRATKCECQLRIPLSSPGHISLHACAIARIRTKTNTPEFQLSWEAVATGIGGVGGGGRGGAAAKSDGGRRMGSATAGGSERAAAGWGGGAPAAIRENTATAQPQKKVRRRSSVMGIAPAAGGRFLRGSGRGLHLRPLGAASPALMRLVLRGSGCSGRCRQSDSSERWGGR